MLPDQQSDVDTERDASAAGAESGRRNFLSSTSLLVMAGGLAGGYGTFFVMAARYLFPAKAEKVWHFVSDAAGIAPGESIPFKSPSGVEVTITRRGDGGDDQATSEENFLALSSICPHLGCRVHWEAHNDRFFCPCHNGVFDADGQPVSGPPAVDGQELPRYPLRIDDGALYIEMPTQTVGG